MKDIEFERPQGTAPAECPGLFTLAVCDGTPRKCFVTALVVGTVLALINHGDTMFAGGSLPWGKIALTYLVPYCVATWGAITAKRSYLRRGRA